MKINKLRLYVELFFVFSFSCAAYASSLGKVDHLDKMIKDLQYVQEQHYDAYSYEVVSQLGFFNKVEASCTDFSNECMSEKSKILTIHLLTLNIIDQLYLPKSSPYDQDPTEAPEMGSANLVGMKEKMSRNIAITVGELTGEAWPYSEGLIHSLGVRWVAQGVCDLNEPDVVREELRRNVTSTKRVSFLLGIIRYVEKNYRKMCTAP